MTVYEVTKTTDGTERVKLCAAHGDSEENKTFSKWTPCATLEMSITNPTAQGVLVPGKSFYLDFTPAE